MRKLTLVGIALAVIGFGTGGSLFALLAFSGETTFEATVKPGGSNRKMNVQSFTVDLTRDMNPLAMNLTVDDNSAGATVKVLDAAGKEIYQRSQNSSSDGGGSAVWFFAPIEIQADGEHRIECRIGSGIKGDINLRRNATLLPIGVAFVGIALGIIGFACIMLSIVRSSIGRIARAPLAD